MMLNIIGIFSLITLCMPIFISAQDTNPESHKATNDAQDQIPEKRSIFKNKYGMTTGVLAFLGVNIGIISYLLNETEQRCSKDIQDLAIQTDKKFADIATTLDQTQDAIRELAQRQRETEQLMVAMVDEIEKNKEQIGEVAEGVKSLKSQVQLNKEEYDLVLQAITQRFHQNEAYLTRVAAQTGQNTGAIDQLTTAMDHLWNDLGELHIDQTALKSRLESAENEQDRQRRRVTTIARKVHDVQSEQEGLKETVDGLSEQQNRQGEVIEGIAEDLEAKPKLTAVDLYLDRGIKVIKIGQSIFDLANPVSMVVGSVARFINNSC